MESKFFFFVGQSENSRICWYVYIHTCIYVYIYIFDMLYVFFWGGLGEWRLKLDQIFFFGWRMLKTKISTLKEIHDMRANSFGKVKHFGFGWLAGCDTCQFQSPSFKHARLCFFLVMFSSTGISRTLTCLISSSRIKCTNRLQNLLYV